MLIMSEPGIEVASQLTRARERAGFSQDEVATLVGQPRPIVSNWESGDRRPNARQLEKLAAIYRSSLEELLGGASRARPDFEQLMFRAAGERLDERGKYETQRFLAFLDDYAGFLQALGEPPGMTRSPFSVGEGFTSKEDVRRRAADARAYLRLGMGPIGDLDGLMDLAGITVYRAPLGADLKLTVSGAFIPHDRVGYSVLINGETAPGRRRFTLAHELAHALFHGGKPSVDFFGRREATERFADAFAAEFLVPTQALRSTVEALGVSRITEAEVVIHLQRLFNVSYAMMLVRLRSTNLLSEADRERFGQVKPVHRAQRLGYATDHEEWGQDPEGWGLERFPRRFLRLLRRALDEERLTVSGAAAMTGLALEDIEEFMTTSALTAEDGQEVEYLSESV